ncbi:hypothetical protein K5V21_16630 [Clostridium sardiniense]|uniref:Uncharacterized protein n=1 Tax=Clostridium sardiniense TaxID=29369 RepID=A0ABS7L2D9_CLOSR|nr:hypothetical protein [Clostridium sardiniense]MBY0757062.1 hypothetical protein [Clostridium sardiniense]MDQ0461780.1 hypothetical protein [Clostridium sardiniense]
MLYKEYRSKKKCINSDSLNQCRKNKRISNYIDLRKNDFKFIDNMSLIQTVLLGIIALGILISANSIVAIHGNFYGNEVEAIIWAIIFESLSLAIVSTFIFIFVEDDARSHCGYLGCIRIAIVVSLIRGMFELVGSGIIYSVPSISRIVFILAILVFQVVTYYIFKNKNILYSKKAILLILLLTLFI